MCQCAQFPVSTLPPTSKEMEALINSKAIAQTQKDAVKVTAGHVRDLKGRQAMPSGVMWQFSVLVDIF